MEIFKKREDEKEVHPAPSLLGLTRSQDATEIEQILRKSTYTIHQGSYVYAKASKRPDKGKHFMITEDDSEITVVTKEENLRHVAVIERKKPNYALIGLNPAAPLYSIGFLASVTNSIAKHKVNLLILSTYSKDYLLVDDKQLEFAKKALISIGLKENMIS